MLNDASEVKFSKSEGGAWMSAKGAVEGVTFDLPVRQPGVTVPVLELFLK